MNQYNTLFGQLLSLIKRPEFNRLCRKHEADKYSKGFSAWNELLVMIFAQISGQNGLRSISNAMNSEYSSFYHLGITRAVNKSTLSYAENTRDSGVYEELYYSLLSDLQPAAKKSAEQTLYAVDATTIGLCMNDFPWAKFRSTKSGVKIHVKYDVSESVPEYLFITNADKHENSTLGSMKLKEGDVVTFDRGYNNYRQFAEFCRQGIYFVTRLKDNADYKVVKRRKTYSGRITSDRIITFTGAVAGKKCPYELRRIRSVDPKTGKAVVLLTNMRSCSASKIASIYRKRWQIELFFKTIKQNLKIKRFYGTSENAVRTQIWIAMIVYILYMMLKKLSGCVTKCFTHFISELSVVLFKHCELFRWVIGSPPERCTDKSMPLLQMELGL